jgi:hypothetical protein
VARPKRKGATETFSVSVSRETKTRLRKAARRGYGGNVSALIEAIALEADRRNALDKLLQLGPPIDERAYQSFLKELAGVQKKRRRSAA